MNDGLQRPYFMSRGLMVFNSYAKSASELCNGGARFIAGIRRKEPEIITAAARLGNRPAGRGRPESDAWL